MRYNPVMVVEQTQPQQNRISQQQFSTNHSSSMETSSHHQQSQDIIQQHQSPHLATIQQQQPKITSSPRPSILRKRDHEGSPLKASKNLTPVLSTMAATAAVQQHQQSLHNQQLHQQQISISPPPRPNSEGNDHSSGMENMFSFWFCDFSEGRQICLSFFYFLLNRILDTLGCKVRIWFFDF